jgi:hypothetical protein
MRWEIMQHETRKETLSCPAGEKVRWLALWRALDVDSSNRSIILDDLIAFHDAVRIERVSKLHLPGPGGDDAQGEELLAKSRVQT